MSSPDMFDLESTPPSREVPQPVNPSELYLFENTPSSGIPAHLNSNVESSPDFTPPSQTLEDDVAQTLETSLNLTPMSPTPEGPTPPTPTSTPLSPPKQIKCCSMRIKFLDSVGNKIKSQICFDPEVISIVSSLIKSSSIEHCKSAASKISDSKLLKNFVEEQVLTKLSNEFQTFVSNKKCPIRPGDFLNSPEQLADIDFDNMLKKCFKECPSLMNALSVICLGCIYFPPNDKGKEDLNNKHQKQRLLAILTIAAFTRNQRVNLYQRVIGEFLKRRNTSKHCLQFLQRVGLSLVTMSIRSDQQQMGSNFLAEVKQRKVEVELWAARRNTLEKAAKIEKIEKSRDIISRFGMVRFVSDDVVEIIEDLCEKIFPPMESSGDTFVTDIILEHGSASGALEVHLDLRPKLQDVTYDNIDIGCLGNEFMMGDADKSKHWTSSIIVEGDITFKLIGIDSEMTMNKTNIFNNTE